VATSCIYHNTQRISLVQTNSSPAHGYVEVSVSGSTVNCGVTNSWGLTNWCTW
jgi:hypothetical protein